MSDQGERASRSVPAGGAATINGILYQILWSLLRASRAHVDELVTDESGTPSKVVLTLEPIGGGGDLIVAEDGRTTVEQLKAKPSGGTWSLREIVEGVIPDLYLACNGDTTETSFRFVTEGRMGRWGEVYRFFRALQNRECPEDDLLSGLDDGDELRFGRRTGATNTDEDAKPFWDRESYTERTLYERIVTEIRKRKVVNDKEDEATTERKLWNLLASFEFVGHQSVDRLQQEIDAHLLAVVDCHDDIPRIRDAMAMDLARRATAGGAEIDAAEVFRAHNLNATPLKDWSRLRDNARRHLDTYLNLRGYDRDLDVRLSAAATTVAQWPEGTPMLAISGESGQGKSWRAFAMAAQTAPRPEGLFFAHANARLPTGHRADSRRRSRKPNYQTANNETTQVF